MRPKEKDMLVATIVRDRKTAKIYVRYAATAQVGGDVDVVDTLNGTDRTELETRAEGFANRLRLATQSLS